MPGSSGRNDWQTSRHAGEGIDEAVAWRTIGIISDEGQSIGTGSAIIWKGIHYFLTAYHVIESNPEDLWFLYRTDGTLKRSDHPDEVPITDLDLNSRQRAQIETVIFDKESDLAALRVRDPSREYNVHFHQLDRDFETPPDGTTVWVMGYPSALARKVSEEGYAGIRAIEVTQILPTFEIEGFDPTLSFIVEYSEKDNVHPRGYSGAGVWYHKGPTEVWHPNLRLAGVCAKYFTAKGYLEIVRVERVIRFLQDFCG